MYDRKPFDRFKINEDQIFKALFDASFVVSYGCIYKVVDTDNVIVKIGYRLESAEKLIQCTYLVPSNANLEVDIEPTVNDHVLVLALQHLDDKMFTETESVQTSELTGYGVLSAVAIPIGTRKGDAKVLKKITKDALSVKTTLPAEISVGSLKLNGEGSHFVKWEELNNVAQSILTTIKSHVHPDPASGMTGASPTLSTLTLDMTSAKTPNLQTGDK